MNEKKSIYSNMVRTVIDDDMGEGRSRRESIINNIRDHDKKIKECENEIIRLKKLVSKERSYQRISYRLE
jgi:hypothetical protein